jgi:tetratricopeptide (TPR) repeat protein
MVWRYKDVSTETRMAAGGLGCLLVFGFFSYPFSILTLKVLAVLFLGIIGRESRVVCSWNVSNSLQSVVGGTAVVCVAFTVYGLMVVSKLSSYAHTDERYAYWFRDNVSFVRHLCQETLERGDTVQAVRILTDAIGRIPVAGFYQHRAELYTETGDYQQAEADYKFLRNLSPTALEPVLKLARLYRDTGRVEEALDTLKPYQKVSPKGKTLEQKAVLLEMRELYQSIH